MTKYFADATVDNEVTIERNSPRAGVWRVVLDDEKHANALTPSIVFKLDSALHEAFASDVRAIIIESSSERFCAGSSLSDIELLTDADLRERFSSLENLLETVRRAPALTIVKVRGVALGAGADLVAACDYRLGTGGARFAFPGTRFGLVLGTRQLAAVVGRQRAREIIVEGQTLDAEDARTCGLLSSLCADERGLNDRVDEILSGSDSIDLPTLRALLRLTRDTASERDHEELLRSTSREGLKARIGKHAQRVREARNARVSRKP